MFYRAAWDMKPVPPNGGLVSFARSTLGESKTNITFTKEGKRDNWLMGKTWGLQLYVPGREDIEIMLSLRVVAKPPLTVALGPNKVINPSSDKTNPSSLPKPIISTTTPVIAFSTSILH